MDRSLVVFQEESLRYSFLETIREYARERLQGRNETQVWQQRHGEYWLAWAEQCGFEIGGAPHVEIMEGEHDNLRTALTWACSAEVNPIVGLRLAYLMSSFWLECGYWREAKQTLVRALEREGEAQGKPLRDAHLSYGFFLWLLNEREEANRILQQCREEYLAEGDSCGAGRALMALLYMAWFMGDMEEAERRAETSLRFLEQGGDWMATGWPLHALGLIALQKRDFEQAQGYFERAYAIDVRKGQEVGGVRVDLASLAIARGDLAHARTLLRESLEAYARHKRYYIVFTLTWFAVLEAEEGDWRRAIRLLGGVDALYFSLRGIPLAYTAEDSVGRMILRLKQ